MTYESRIAQRVDKLISDSEAVIKTAKQPGPSVIGEPIVDDETMAQLRTSALNFLESVFGETSAHYVEFNKNCSRSKISSAKKAKGILKAAKDDIENGFVQKMKIMVSADIFNDFIEMGEYLMSEGFYHAAASLAGAVLEDSLRKISGRKNLEISKGDRLFQLNAKLQKADVYNKITWKNIEVWREIRNNADHGKFEEVTATNVDGMVNGIKGFLKDHLR